MHQTVLQGTFLGLKIQSLEQTSFLTARTVQISQKQGCLSDPSKANVNLFCHPHSGFSLANVPEGSRISTHHFLSLILQPHHHQSQGGSVTSSRRASDKGLLWGGGALFTQTNWHCTHIHTMPLQHPINILQDATFPPTSHKNLSPSPSSVLLSDRCPRSCPSASLSVAACLSNDNMLCPSLSVYTVK